MVQLLAGNIDSGRLFLEYTVDVYRQGGETYESNLVSSLLIIGNMHKILEEAEEAEGVWTDAYEISKKTDTILGYVCDQLAVKDKYGTKTYYYSSELSLNPSYYKNFTSSNKDKIVSLMQAVYLRLDMSFPEISVQHLIYKMDTWNVKKRLVNLEVIMKTL